MSKFTMVYYYVPEDKDDPDYPNAFGINLAQEDIKLKDIRNAFPLEGEYHFRFKYKVNNQVVWMDLPSENSGLPLFSSKIFIKATRISWESTIQLAYKQNNQRFNDDVQMRASSKVFDEVKRETTPKNSMNTSQTRPQQQQQQQPQQPQQSQYSQDFDLLGSGPSSSYGNSQPSANQYGGGHSKNKSQDLYDMGFDDNQNKQPKQGSNNFEFDLL